MVNDFKEAAAQVLYCYPDETIDAMVKYFDEEFDYILDAFDRTLRYSILAEEMVLILQNVFHEFNE